MLSARAVSAAGGVTSCWLRPVAGDTRGSRAEEIALGADYPALGDDTMIRARSAATIIVTAVISAQRL